MVKHITPINPALAELIGIIIGDGCLYWGKNGRHAWLIITSNFITDRNYLQNRVCNLFEKEFRVKPRIRKDKTENTLRLFVYSKSVAKEFINLGLPKNKKLDYIRIPKFIFKNKSLLISCLRGIFDTDGSIYSKYGRYAQIGFRAHSKKLLEDIKVGLRMLGFNPSVDRAGYVFIHRQLEVIKFFKLIGSANPKHIIRYLIWRNDHKVPKVNAVIKEINSFQSKLPYIDLKNKKHQTNFLKLKC